jgi:hypothetical protein
MMENLASRQNLDERNIVLSNVLNVKHIRIPVEGKFRTAG